MTESRTSLLRAIDKISDAEFRLTGVSRLLAALVESSSVVNDEELEVLVSITMDLSEQLGEAREIWEKALEDTRTKDVTPITAATAGTTAALQ